MSKKRIGIECPVCEAHGIRPLPQPPYDIFYICTNCGGSGEIKLLHVSTRLCMLFTGLKHVGHHRIRLVCLTISDAATQAPKGISYKDFLAGEMPEWHPSGD